MKYIFLFLSIIFFSISAFSQEQETSSGFSLGDINVSGYIQLQYQYGEKDALLEVGANNENPEKAFNRIGVRRGRLKFAYEKKIFSSVFQMDITENGIDLRDVYIDVTEPWMGIATLRAGVFDRPFGYEINYSSSRRESPERSAIFQTLFPQGRDMGAMLQFQAPETSPWHILKLETGLFAGNGIKRETDSRKDFIGHLSAYKMLNNMQFGAGVSYYNGSVYQGTSDIYTMSGNGFVLNSDARNKGQFAKREYVGVDAQFSLKTLLGTTNLRAEYIFGQQPAIQHSVESPNSSTLPDDDTYIRNVNGWYVMFVQDIGRLPFQLVAKYDMLDPNTDISGNQVGEINTSITDLMQNTFGFGALWHINTDFMLMAYYEINNYEKTINLPAIAESKRDVFTLRLQYRF